MGSQLVHALIAKVCKLTTPVDIDEETAKICAKNSDMFHTVSVVQDVFKTPQIAFSEVNNYQIKPMYIKIFGKQVKIPEKYVCYDVSSDVKYYYRYGEFTITQLPYALFIRRGKVYKCVFDIPKTEVTSVENFFNCVLEFVNGRGSHAGNLGKTVEYLGKFSIGVPFGEELKYEVKRGNDLIYPNSRHFVVDRSYIVNDKLKEYDLACKRYNANESPFMI